MTVECPAVGCDFSGDRKSVRGHFGGSIDAAHRGSFKTALKAADSSTEGASESSGDSVSPGENPMTNAPESAPRADSGGSGGSGGSSGPACCDSPALRDVEPGRTVRLDDGRLGTTEQGDEMCVNCEALISGGEVFR